MSFHIPSQIPEAARDGRVGVLRVAWPMIQVLVPELSLDLASLQGEVREAGIFQRLQDRLLLPPELLKVFGLFFHWPLREWHVYLCGPLLLPVKPGEAVELVEFHYSKHDDGTIEFTRVSVLAPDMTVRLSGGLDELIRLYGKTEKEGNSDQVD